MSSSSPPSSSRSGERPNRVRLSARQWAIACWGVGGVLLLLSQALYRLTPLALEPLLDGTMTSPQWALYIGWSLFNAYAEGYRGFQRAFSPRVVARAIHLANHPRTLHVVLAPLFCMAFFHARRRNLILAWGVTSLIVTVIVAVRQLPQPWRGIIDGGVVVGLVWGVLSLAWLLARVGLRGEVPGHDSLPLEANADHRHRRATRHLNR